MQHLFKTKSLVGQRCGLETWGSLLSGSSETSRHPISSVGYPFLVPRDSGKKLLILVTIFLLGFLLAWRTMTKVVILNSYHLSCSTTWSRLIQRSFLKLTTSPRCNLGQFHQPAKCGLDQTLGKVKEYIERTSLCQTKNTPLFAKVPRDVILRQ